MMSDKKDFVDDCLKGGEAMKNETIKCRDDGREVVLLFMIAHLAVLAIWAVVGAVAHFALG